MHVAHALDYLFHETKVGGWVAGLCAVVGGGVAYLTQPFMVETCTNGVLPICSKVFDSELFGDTLGAAVIGGGIGILIATILVSLGVSKDTLGIDE